jgi:hypothetical protein
VLSSSSAESETKDDAADEA